MLVFESVAKPFQEGMTTFIGAPGAELEIDDWFVLDFSVEGVRHIFLCYAPELEPVDMLLGLGWLNTIVAIINFFSLTDTFGRHSKDLKLLWFQL